MSYVDAGYAVALVSLSGYGVALLLRRRRWERALRIAAQDERPPVTAPAADAPAAPAPGGRP